MKSMTISDGGTTSTTDAQTRHRNKNTVTSSLEMQPLPTEDYDDDDLDDLNESIDNILHRSGFNAYKDSDNDDELDDEMIAKMAEDAVMYGSGHGKLHDWLFPPNVPRTVQLLRWENVAVPSCYLLVGILQGLSGPLMNVYPLDLGASEAQQATISSLRGLPATFKLLFGFWSDNYLLFGYRRKSYMGLGWLVASGSMIVLLMFGRHNPSIPLLSFSFLTYGVGFWFADVMADSIVAEKAKHEPPESRGSLQSTCYACRFFGLMVAAPISTVIYSSLGPNHVIAVLAVFPLLILPLVYMFQERFNVTVKTTSEQCKEIWSTVCSRAVWQPMGFVSVSFFLVFLYSCFLLHSSET